jgi:hypothetical protein
VGGPDGLLVRLRCPDPFSENERFMKTPFSPTRQDVERYRRFRALSRDLNHRIIKTIPRHAYDEVGDAIGVLHNGVLVFDSEDMASVMMDCCLYDWFEDGKNLVQRYAETHPAKPGTDESYLMGACTQAKYRVLMVQSAVPDAGLHCRDVLNNEELFLMHLAMSRSFGTGDTAIATRTISLGEYWMSGGAGLPINSKKTILDALSRIESRKHDLLEGPGSVALVIVRACLAAGVADYVRYENAGGKPRKPRRKSRRAGHY